MLRVFAVALVLLLGCQGKGPQREQLACVGAECQADDLLQSNSDTEHPWRSPRL